MVAQTACASARVTWERPSLVGKGPGPRSRRAWDRRRLLQSWRCSPGPAGCWRGCSEHSPCTPCLSQPISHGRVGPVLSA